MKSPSSMGLGSLVSQALGILDEIEETRRSVFAGIPNRKDKDNKTLDQVLKTRLDHLVSGLSEERRQQLIRHYELVLTPFVGEWSSYFFSYRERFKDQADKVTWKWLESEIKSIETAKQQPSRSRDLHSRAVAEYLRPHSDSIDPHELQENERRITSAFAQNQAIGMCVTEGLEFDIELWKNLLRKIEVSSSEEVVNCYISALRSRKGCTESSSQQTSMADEKSTHPQVFPCSQLGSVTEHEASTRDVVGTAGVVGSAPLITRDIDSSSSGGDSNSDTTRFLDGSQQRTKRGRPRDRESFRSTVERLFSAIGLSEAPASKEAWVILSEQKKIDELPSQFRTPAKFKAAYAKEKRRIFSDKAEPA